MSGKYGHGEDLVVFQLADGQTLVMPKDVPHRIVGRRMPFQHAGPASIEAAHSKWVAIQLGTALEELRAELAKKDA